MSADGYAGLDSMSIPDLKAALDARGQNSTGLKPALQQRLKECLETETVTGVNKSVANVGVPDDSLKLFVGQVPPTYTEEQFRDTFAPYGQVVSVVILKDRFTQQPKGCGFVTMSTRAECDAVIASLAEVVTLPGAKRTLIINYATKNKAAADTNNPGATGMTGEAKLYVGMLSRASSEQDIRALFEPFGDITEVYIMKNKGTEDSKGSAFVKFASRAAAQKAIDKLNENYRDKESPGMLQVRFAQTKQEIFGGNGMGMGGMMGGMGGMASMMGMAQMGQAMGGMADLGGMGMPDMSQMQQMLGGGDMNQMNQLQQQMGQQMPQDPMQNQMGQMGQMQNPQQWQGDMSQLYGAQGAQDYSSYGFNPYGLPAGAADAGLGLGGMAGGMTGGMAGGSAVASGRPDITKGPPGSNIFVYGIPETYSDQDLAGLFQNFGGILSAKVQIDLQSGKSKGFGFVSFTEPKAAQMAISTMEGFVIGSKRLNVKLKKEAGAPGIGGYGASNRYAPY